MSAYGTDDGLTAWLAAQALSLPEGSPSEAVLRQIGSSYVDAAYEYRLQCSRRAGGFAQELAWPRTGQFVNGESVPDDFIPPAWVNASYRAAYLSAVTPGWATASIDATRQTRREKVDVVEREYFASADAAGSDAAPGMASDGVINGMVLPWLCKTTRRFGDLFRVI